ncbi:MAG: VIT1/CCC1 transporter family protein [Deltaproteobacteria bacterium]|nr:VIT1/CCC1 transporter family protein [Deltaproteobacteria bacterium]
MAKQEDVARYRANLQGEVNSAALYDTLAELEPKPQLAEVYRRLAEVEERHAQFWEQKLRLAGQPVPPPQPGWQSRVLGWLAKRLGSQFVLPVVATLEQLDRHGYNAQPESRATTLPTEERSHALLLGTIAGTSPTGMEGGTLARLEGRHRAIGGNALRAAVLGANDGLVSNLSLVMGVAGADLSGRAILITGLAGLLAGAASMALGEWLSVQSSRELYQRQIAIEAQELAAVPDEEKEELALIYEAKGLPKDEARPLAARLIADETSALKTLSREELGVDPEELGGSAWVAAGMSFVLFTIGAMLPVAPFTFLTRAHAVIVSLVVSALALFLIGAGITLLTGRKVFSSGTRQVLFGLAAAGLTYGIGRVLGVTLAG